jgi:hypothetical protein
MLALLSASTARADAGAIALGALGGLVPGDVGIAASDPANPRLLIGWSYQIPLPLFTANAAASDLIHHRLVPAVELLPTGSVAWRGRFGYRYDRNHAFGGLGVGVDRSGVNVSPELGVKFLQVLYEPGWGIEMSLHLLARVEIDAETGHPRGGTFLLGWNLL